MATTAAGEQLVERHRQAQLQIRAQALRDYLTLWRGWQGDDDSFLQIASAVVLLVQLYRGMSSAVAADFYELLRREEGVRGTFPPRLAPEIGREQVAGTLWLLGPEKVRRVPRPLRDDDAIGRELDALTEAVRAAMDTAFVDTSGAVTKMVLDGGRETIVESTKADPAAVGWARTTDGDPCAFCVMLASRGAVYKEDTVGFQAHAHCGCSATPVFHRDDPLPQNRQWLDEYNAATRAARAAGDLRRGTSNDLLNALRRYRAGAYS